MTDKNHFIIHAVAFEKGGSCSDLDEAQIAQGLEDKKLAWVHLEREHIKTRKWVEKNLDFLDPLIIDALFDDETRPRVEEFGDGLLVNLRAANLHKGQESHDMLSIRLWIDSRQIISVRRRRVFAASDILEKLRAGRGPETAGRFLADLILGLVDHMEPIIVNLDEKTDDLEEKIINEPNFQDRRDIVTLRQKTIIFRRFMAPQREAVAKLRVMDKPWIDQRCRIAFMDSYDHLYRFIEDLDSIRERLQVVQDELTNYLSDQLNKRMYVLSIVAAIFLPLSFLTGLLGINVAGIWGADYPQAFSVFIAIMVVIVILMALYFKKKKWF